MDRDYLLRAVVLTVVAVLPTAAIHLFTRPRRRSAAQKDLDRAKLEREVMTEVVRAEVAGAAARVLVERSGREAAEAERAAIETAARERIAAIETAARERIDAAFVAAYRQYTRIVGDTLASIYAELQRDGLPPPAPPKLAWAASAPAETVPEAEVVGAQVRAAHLVRPDRSTTHGVREVSGGVAPPAAWGGVEPKKATASSPTLVCVTAPAAAEGPKG